jgi:hypothetical protein
MSAVAFSRIGLLVAFGSFAGACRTATPSPSQSQYRLSVSSAESAAKRGRNVLGYTEFAQWRTLTAYDVVERYRPEFLQRRLPASAGSPTGGFAVVYIDGNRQGGTDVLRTIPATAVEEIRYLSPAAAGIEFGWANPGGIILVRFRR